MYNTPNWQKRLEIFVMFPAVVLDYIIEFTRDFIVAFKDADLKELPEIKKKLKKPLG